MSGQCQLTWIRYVDTSPLMSKGKFLSPWISPNSKLIVLLYLRWQKILVKSNAELQNQNIHWITRFSIQFRPHCWTMTSDVEADSLFSFVSSSKLFSIDNLIEKPWYLQNRLAWYNNFSLYFFKLQISLLYTFLFKSGISLILLPCYLIFFNLLFWVIRTFFSILKKSVSLGYISELIIWVVFTQYVVNFFHCVIFRPCFCFQKVFLVYSFKY